MLDVTETPMDTLDLDEIEVEEQKIALRERALQLRSQKLKILRQRKGHAANDKNGGQQEQEQLDDTCVVVCGQQFGGPPPSVTGISFVPPMMAFPPAQPGQMGFAYPPNPYSSTMMMNPTSLPPRVAPSADGDGMVTTLDKDPEYDQHLRNLEKELELKYISTEEFDSYLKIITAARHSRALRAQLMSGKEKFDKRAESRWTAKTGGGNYVNDETTWKLNPQLLMRVHKKSIITISLTLPYKFNKMQDDEWGGVYYEEYIRFQVLQGSERKTVYNQQEKVTEDNECLNTIRSVWTTCEFEPGNYIVVPSSRDPRTSMQFSMRFESNQPINLVDAKGGSEWYIFDASVATLELESRQLQKDEDEKDAKIQQSNLDDVGVGMFVLFCVLWYIPFRSRKDVYYPPIDWEPNKDKKTYKPEDGAKYSNLSLVFLKPLPLLIVGVQYVMLLAVFLHSMSNYEDGWCNRGGTLANRALMSGVGALYFVRATSNIQKKYQKFKDSGGFSGYVGTKMDTWLTPAYQFDIFMEMCFGAAVLMVNLWLVFIATDPVDMVLNSLAVEFIGNLDNELKTELFEYVTYYDFSASKGKETAPPQKKTLETAPPQKKTLADAVQKELETDAGGCVQFFGRRLWSIVFLSFVSVISLMLPVVCVAVVFYGPFCKM